MKKINNLFTLFTLGALFLFSACEKEADFVELTPETEAPTITVVSPEMPANNEFTPTVGETITFTINVADNEGLSQVFVNGEPIKTYMGVVTEDEISYDFPIANEEVKELVFSVEDAWRNTASTAKMTFFPVPAENPAYVLIDFAGQSTANESKTVVGWDNRTVYTFNVATPHTTSATAEVAASQARLGFAMPNPDGSGKVLEIVKQPMEGFDNWGGWANVIFNLKNAIPAETVEALPQYDATTEELTAGTKVLKMDVYYDATVDPDYSWENVTSASDVWNSDPSQGYKIDVVLANYEKHANTEGGYDNAGYYISYSAYIPEPNKWVTLTFDMVDAGRVGSFGGATAAEVNAIDIKPAPGYSGDDSNSLFIKNLRIEDVEE